MGSRGQYDPSAVTVIRRFARMVFLLAALVAVLAGAMVVIGPSFVDLVSAHRSDHEQINLAPLAERSMIYDALGNLQGTMTNRNDPQNRSQVSLKDIPETVIGPVLAAEDAHFYDHKGINIRSILRAVDANLESGSISQGGSTITQQVVKNSLVGDERDLSRKLREAFLAIELEKQMTKDEILERYLNSVYLGGGAYGVQAASEYYFGKDVGDLNWSEGALLAALIRNPRDYDPFKNPKLARERRTIVFKRLIATEKLTPDEVLFSETVPLPTVAHKPVPPYDYFVEEVKQQLLHDSRFGLGATDAARYHTVYEGGIRVYTTFSPVVQSYAIQARNETLPRSQDGGLTFPVQDTKNDRVTFGTQAMASVEPSTGAVRAMVGGPGFDRWQFNLATERDPGRQPGSTMKGFVLATLFDATEGYVPTDTINGSSCSFKFPGEKKLYSLSGGAGTGTIQKMTQLSSNCAFMRLSQVAGVANVALMATRLGIRSDLYLHDSEGNPTQPPYNLTLGTMGVSPLDMAAAYSVFANDGLRNEPYMVDRIEDRTGKVIYQHQHRPERIISTQTARLVNSVLVSNVTGGTGRRAKIDGGQQAAGKTGTTNDSTDVWFVGYTPELSTAIWMGAPAGSISLARAGLGGATGGRYPAATWGRLYSMFYDGRPKVDFVKPEPTRKGRAIRKVPYDTAKAAPRRTPTKRPTTSSSTTTSPNSTPTTATPPGNSTPGGGGAGNP